MFLNRSSIGNASSTFTQEVKLTMSQFSGLKVFSGESKAADAVLIGIITSDKYKRSLNKVSNTQIAEGAIEESLGERVDMTYPSEITYKLALRLALIKKPTAEERKLLEGKIGEQILSNGKVIFNESIPIQGTFSKTIGDTLSSDSSGIVNFTRNKQIFEENLNAQARAAALTFKQTVLNAF